MIRYFTSLLSAFSAVALGASGNISTVKSGIRVEVGSFEGGRSRWPGPSPGQPRLT
jgi:hypothetical protein